MWISFRKNRQRSETVFYNSFKQHTLIGQAYRLDPFYELTPKQYDHVKKLTDQIHKQFINDLQMSRNDKIKSDSSIDEASVDI